MSSHKRQQLYLDSERCCLPFKSIFCILLSILIGSIVGLYILSFRKAWRRWQKNKQNNDYVQLRWRGTFNIREWQSNEEINKNIVRVWWAVLKRCAIARNTIIIRHFHVHHVLYSHVSLEIAHSFHNKPFFGMLTVPRVASQKSLVTNYMWHVMRFSGLFSGPKCYCKPKWQ